MSELVSGYKYGKLIHAGRDNAWYLQTDDKGRFIRPLMIDCNQEHDTLLTALNLVGEDGWRYKGLTESHETEQGIDTEYIVEKEYKILK